MTELLHQQIKLRISNVEISFDSKESGYLEIKKRLNDLASKKGTQFEKAYNYNVQQYIEYVQSKAIKNQNLILPQLRQMCQLAKLNLSICNEPKLNQECESKCHFDNNSSWRNSMFCQICADTPIARFIEQIEMTKQVSNYDNYLFNKIIWMIVKQFGMKTNKKYDFMCTPNYLKNCKNCAQLCNDNFKKKFGTEWKIYASGLRFIDEAMTVASKLKALDIVQPILLIDKFIKMVQNEQVASWIEINELIDLLNIIPLFVKRAISTVLLEPQGIRLFSASLQDTTKKSQFQIWLEKLLI